MNCKRFLILSASTGNGHLSAAKALEDELVARGYCVLSADVLDHCPNGFRAWYAGGYETLVRRKPEMWGHLYRSSDRPLFNYWFQTWLDWTFCKGLDKLVESFQPTCVICTHSLPQPRLAALRRRLGFQIAVVVTDLHPHRMWLRGEPDLFFLPIRESQAVLEARLPSSVGKNKVSGIPINRAFCRKRPDRAPGPVRVLLTSGGIGGGPLIAAAKALAALPIELRVVAGRNKQTQEQLSSEFAGVSSVQTFGLLSQDGFADQLAEADILVSKPGGLTTFEALASGTAFVILEDLIIPGQEEDNAKFLVDCGAGVSARGLENVVDVVRRLIDSPERLTLMRKAAVENAFPDAARDIVDTLAEASEPE